MVREHVHCQAKGKFELAYDDLAPIGSGRQARIYRLLEVDGKPVDDWFLKIYFDQTPLMRRHAVNFAAYIGTNELQAGGLLGLPREALVWEDGSGRAGYLMHVVPGGDLDNTNLYGWLKSQPLVTRLSLAWQLSDSVARLHERRIIHADISDSNIVLDESQKTAYLIDADGGGVLQTGTQDRFETDLFPLVQGKDQTMAPELLKDSSQFPSQHGDNYSLAVMIHRLLMPSGRSGIHPFFFLSSMQETTEARVGWPPDPDRYPSKKKAILAHASLLRAMGAEIVAMFETAFGPGRVGNSALRPAAQRWADELEKAARWVYACSRSQCGKEFVAWRVRSCPFCQAPVTHAKVGTASLKEINVDADTTLHSSDLGFTDGNYDAFSIRREGLFLELETKAIRSPNSFRVASGKAKKCEVKSMDGQQTAWVRVEA